MPQATIDPEDHVLTITGERVLENVVDDPNADFLRVERKFGKFVRAFQLPPAIDLDAVTAQVGTLPDAAWQTLHLLVQV